MISELKQLIEFFFFCRHYHYYFVMSSCKKTSYPIRINDRVIFREEIIIKLKIPRGG